MTLESLPLTTIGIIIVIAIALSTLVKKFGQNPVLGFIIAGFLLGPFFLGFLSPEDPLVIGFGEMGLFILLFYLGLELSLKDFLAAGTKAFGLALIDMAGLIGIGFLISYALGFSLLFSIIIGFFLFATSTAIVAKFALDNNLIELPPAKLAVSILILQDFLGILLLVFVTSLSEAGVAVDLAITSVMFAVAAFFVVYQLSQRVEDWLLKNSFGHIEVTLYAVGIGLIIATLADVVNLSTALGAYFAGFALAETRAGKRIKSDIHFLRDFFLVFFFVSFGTTIFFSHELGKVVIPETAQLLFLLGVALLLAAGIVIINLLVFSIFGPLFGLKREDASISAIMLTPLGEFVVIIAATATTVLSGQEALILPTVAFLLIATTVIIFQPLYSMIELHRKISAMLPNIFPLREKSAIEKHTPETIQEIKGIALNLFVVLAMAWMTFLLYNELPRFGVPVIYSRQVTAIILFAFFASVPFFKVVKASGRLARLAKEQKTSQKKAENGSLK